MIKITYKKTTYLIEKSNSYYYIILIVCLIIPLLSIKYVKADELES